MSHSAWSIAPMICANGPGSPHWIEEPIAADEPHEAWRAVARQSEIPLAAGENLRGQQAFDDALDAASPNRSPMRSAR